MQCIKSFSGNDNCEELKELKKFSEIKSKFNDEPEYITQLELYLLKFENIIKSKKGRSEIIQKNKKEKEIKLIKEKKDQNV